MKLVWLILYESHLYSASAGLGSLYLSLGSIIVNNIGSLAARVPFEIQPEEAILPNSGEKMPFRLNFKWNIYFYLFHEHQFTQKAVYVVCVRAQTVVRGAPYSRVRCSILKLPILTSSMYSVPCGTLAKWIGTPLYIKRVRVQTETIIYSIFRSSRLLKKVIITPNIKNWRSKLNFMMSKKNISRSRSTYQSWNFKS